MQVEFPSYSRRERIVDFTIHVAGVVFGLIGAMILIAMATRGDSILLTVGVAIYGAGLIAMLGCSALYNMAEDSPHKELFRRLDQAAIFVMIAGSYTPFTLSRIGGAWGIGLLAFVWLVAAIGIAIQLFHPRGLERFSVALYLLLGWSILIAIDPLLRTVSMSAVILLAVGGLLYSVGVIFHLWERLPYQNAIWHGFVLAAAVCHYSAVLSGVVLPAAGA